LKNQIDGTTQLPRGAAEQVYDKHALVLPGETEPTLVVLRRTEAMLESLRNQHGNLAVLTQLAADFQRLCNGIRNKPVAEIGKPEYFAACALRRQIMFADPLLTDIDRILFLGRACYAGSHLTNAWNTDWMGWHFTTQNFSFNTIHGGGIFTIVHRRDKNPTVVNLIESLREAVHLVDDGFLMSGAGAFAGICRILPVC